MSLPIRPDWFQLRKCSAILCPCSYTVLSSYPCTDYRVQILSCRDISWSEAFIFAGLYILPKWAYHHINGHGAIITDGERKYLCQWASGCIKFEYLGWSLLQEIHKWQSMHKHSLTGWTVHAKAKRDQFKIPRTSLAAVESKFLALMNLEKSFAQRIGEWVS